jgi:TRAP transporter TAXI family solute receptor
MLRKALNLVALLMLLCTPVAGAADFDKEWGKSRTFATGSIGGTVHVWGGGFSQFVKKILGKDLIVEVSGATAHNIILVQNKDADFGISNEVTFAEAWNGVGDWTKGKTFKDVRPLFPAFSCKVIWWTLQKNKINTIEDINGRVQSLSSKGGFADTYGRLFLKILDVKPSKIVHGGNADLVGVLKDGGCDASMVCGGSPYGPALETEATHDMNLIKVSDAQLDKIIKDSGLPFSRAEISSRTYKHMTEPYQTLQSWQVVFAHKDIPEEIAYQLTKAYYENIKFFENVFKESSTLTPAIIETIRFGGAPIHPGALRYYEEKGFTPAN